MKPDPSRDPPSSPSTAGRRTPRARLPWSPLQVQTCRHAPRLPPPPPSEISARLRWGQWAPRSPRRSKGRRRHPRRGVAYVDKQACRGCWSRFTWVCASCVWTRGGSWGWSKAERGHGDRRAGAEGPECAESAEEVTVPGEWSERECAGRCVGGNSYLPGRGDTIITKVVFPGRGLFIVLLMC